MLGVCNGFQVLTELGLLPGALMRNSGLKFVCREVGLRVATAPALYRRLCRGQKKSPSGCTSRRQLPDRCRGLAALKDQDRIAFTYASAVNGSVEDIAGILSANRRVLGMMPHPERAASRFMAARRGEAVRSLGHGDLSPPT